MNMSTINMSTIKGGRPMYEGYEWVPVEELTKAVVAGFLTQEEARLVVWSRLPELQRAAATTPPPIEA